MDLPFQAAGLRKVETSFGRFMQVVFEEHRLSGPYLCKAHMGISRNGLQPKPAQCALFEKHIATWQH